MKPEIGNSVLSETQEGEMVKPCEDLTYIACAVNIR